MDMVDEKKIALNPAYELSFLKKEEQVDLLDAMDSEQATPSLSQAQRLKKYSQEGHLTLDMMRVIMGEEKKSDLDRVTFTSDTLRKYFPKSYTPPADAGNHHQAAGGNGRKSVRETRNDERSRL